MAEENNYEHVPKACVNGHNIVKYPSKTVAECMALCSAEINCLAFEYGVQHGGKTRYLPRDCQLQNSADRSACDGILDNLDLYIKKGMQWIYGLLEKLYPKTNLVESLPNNICVTKFQKFGA